MVDSIYRHLTFLSGAPSPKPRSRPKPPTVQLERPDGVGGWTPIPRRHSLPLAERLMAENPGKYRVKE